MSDVKNKAKDIIVNAILRSINDPKKTVGEVAEMILNQLLELGMLLPPCEVGDTVYWLDAILQISPIEVGGFKAGVVGKNGNTYMGGFCLTEEEAKARREYLRKKDCEECFKSGIKGGYLVGCEKDFDCTKKEIKKEFCGLWLEQVKQPQVTDYDYSLGYEYHRCKRCFMRRLEKGQSCSSDEASCPYVTQKTIHSEKWIEEFIKGKDI